jgi:hypothetical protein
LLKYTPSDNNSLHGTPNFPKKKFSSHPSAGMVQCLKKVVLRGASNMVCCRRATCCLTAPSILPKSGWTYAHPDHLLLPYLIWCTKPPSLKLAISGTTYSSTVQ